LWQTRPKKLPITPCIFDEEILIPSDNIYQPEEIVKCLRENLKENDDVSQSQLQQTNAADSQLCRKRGLENTLLTQLERAKQVVESRNISLDPHLKTFTVMGSSGQPRVVTLHPKESCSCPSNATCYLSYFTCQVKYWRNWK